jgi:hypothetical protein
MSRGVLMYAHNNSEIDYFRIACANALMIKKNLGVPVALVTDEGTLQWGKTELGDSFIKNCFEHIILTDRQHAYANTRNYNDTIYTTKALQFYNCNHWEAYALSPYDETLFIDADYLIMSDELNKCWGSNNDFMINHSIFNPGDTTPPYSKHIDDFGIRLYWATVIYFKKSDFSKFIFSIVKHIQENYTYYRELYYFDNGMFRNDYAFSIAIHMLNGFVDNESLVQQLPISALLMSWDTSDIYTLNDINDITLYCEKLNDKGKYILARIRNQDIHIMNKWSIRRISDEIFKVYA